MSEYVTKNCIESCPKCKHKIRMVLSDIRVSYEDDLYESEHYELDCDYLKNIIINQYTQCNGMFEPKEAPDA